MYSRREFLKTAAAGATSLLLPKSASATGPIRQTCNRIDLADGRKLGYAEYGDPNGAVTILYFHGVPSSRLDAALIHDAAWEQNCRILAIDRPGIGLSSFQPNRRITDWPRDIEQFIAAMDVREFSVIGMSAGGPYALACARWFAASALRSVAVINGVAPAHAPVDGGTSAEAFAWARRRPRLVSLRLRSFERKVRRRPERTVRRAASDMAAEDQAFLCNPTNRQQFINAFLEAVRCGPEGVVTELRLHTCKWGFELQEVTHLVRLWYAECDLTCPYPIGEYFAGQLPNASLEIFSGHGHISVVKGHPVRKILKQIKLDSANTGA